MSAYYAAIFATSTLKPLFGGLSDCLPLAGWRRRGIMLPGCVLAAACTAALGAAVHTRAALYAAGVGAALGFCAAEAAADGALVETAGGCREEAAALQVAAMSVRTASGAVASLAGAALLRVAPPRAVICVAAACGAAAAGASVLLPERTAGTPVGSASSRNCSAAGGASSCAGWRSSLLAAADLAGRAWRAVVRVAVAAALLFALGATPRSDTAYAAFLASGLRPPLADWQLGAAVACDTAGALAGTLAYGALSDGRPTRLLLAAGTALAAVGSLLRIVVPLGCLGLPQPAVVALAAVGVSASARFAFMPQLVLCGQLAPPGGEAAAFAALTALLDGGALAGAGLSAALTAALRVGDAPGRSWRNLPALVAACAACRVLPLLLLLPLLPASQGGAAAPSAAAPLQTHTGQELTEPLLGTRDAAAELEDMLDEDGLTPE